MKIALVALLFAASAFAQSQYVALPTTCGPDKTHFEVTLDKSEHTLAQPEVGKALVYFIQDDGLYGNHEHFTVRIGLDGAWVGAYKNNSYFAVSMSPGEHHLCANVQSQFSVGSLVALAHFTAEAGKVYYFRTQFLGGMTSNEPIPPYLSLDQPDSDQAKYLIDSYPLSVSKRKK
jgi:hypothetical protein